MESAAQVLKGTTLREKKSLDFSREVLETAICKCGKEYDSHIKTGLFGKEHEHRLKMCDDCYKEEDERKYQEEQNKQFLEASLRRFNSESLLNPKLKAADFDSYLPTNEQLAKAKAVCERYANNFDLDNPVNLLLIGNYGTGKSHLGVSISKEVMHTKFKSALFISTPKLLTKIRSTYNRNNYESEEDVIGMLSRVSLLVLDDIGSEQSKPSNEENEQSWATSKIFEVIDNRIGKHTIFTTNYSVEELQERIGGRNFSRMMENTHVIKMYGDDYRLKDFK